MRRIGLFVLAIVLGLGTFVGVADAVWLRGQPHVERVAIHNVHLVGVDTFTFQASMSDADGGHLKDWSMTGSKKATSFTMVDQNGKNLVSSYATLVWYMKKRAYMPGDVYFYWKKNSAGKSYRYASRIMFGPWAE